MLIPREYQQKIFETAKEKNTLVVLPTGLGKTLIALLLTKERLNKFPNPKIVFLAPTRPLVEQHFNYFTKNLEENIPSNKESKWNIHIFTGKITPKKRKEIWQDANLIFSTPQCIENDLQNGLINLNEVSLLIEDECHRCLKNYSYVYVAKEYLKQAKNPRLLGLTASPNNDLSMINQICDNLGIEAVEIRSRESEDVKQYLQKLTKNIYYVELIPEMQAVAKLFQNLYEKKVEELKNRKLIFSRATKITLLELQKKLRTMLSSGQNDFNVLRGISVCAQAIKISHAVELIQTQGITQTLSYMRDMIEQDQQGKSKAVKQIVSSREFQDSFIILTKLVQEGIEHPKFSKLLEIIEERIQIKKNSRIIVFAQFRDTGAKIKELLNCKKINSSVFIGQAKKNGIGLSQDEQAKVIQEFKQGKINVLISTSIGEEGLDIPEVDLVIFYEPIPSAIRKIQRTGRTARLNEGEVIFLITKDTRDEQYYWSSYHKEKKMYSALEKIKDHLNGNGKEKEGVLIKKEEKPKSKQKKILDFD